MKRPQKSLNATASETASWCCYAAEKEASMHVGNAVIDAKASARRQRGVRDLSLVEHDHASSISALIFNNQKSMQ